MANKPLILTSATVNKTDGTEAISVDASGNVGIGVTPAHKLDVNGAIGISGTKFLSKISGNSYWWNNTTATYWVDSTGNTIQMALDSTGNLLVGTTSTFGAASAKLQVVTGAIAIKGTSGSDSSSLYFYRADTGANTWKITTNDVNFYIADADFSHYAYLSQNPTTWVWGSDRRLKKDIQDCSYGLAEVLKMQPRQYKFISSGKEDVGFIAQELKEVIPEAVSGEEVPYTEEDTPQDKAKKSLGVSKDTLIPVLVKAIQELSAKNDALEARLAAMETK